MGILDRLLHDNEEDLAQPKIIENKTEEAKPKIDPKVLITSILIFIAAVAVRLFYLFIVEDPQNAGVGWYGDTYHHWQIAYLSKEIGLQEGFLRLWDIKGLEFFWGLLHPLITIILMAITGSKDIILVRLLSTVAGSAGIMLLFLLAKKHWGFKVGLAAALIAIFNPVLIFNDISGMVEPLGILFLLAALLNWPEKSFLTGIFLALTSMSRAENWLFSLGILFAIVVFTKAHADKKVSAVLSYGLVILFYMKYLLDYTGNAIYPLWWNFLGNAAGKWQADVPARPDQAAIQPVWIAMFVVSLIGIIFVIWKKPKNQLFHLLGLGSFLFLGFFVGFTEYLKSYEAYFWVVRIFDLPYLYLGALLSLWFFEHIPNKLKFFGKIKLHWVVLIGIIVAMQPVWNIIRGYYKPTQKYWEMEKTIASDFKGYYKGGKVLIHEGDPVLTYSLIKYGGLDGKNIIGQMYDPFTYKPFIEYKNTFDNWGEDRELIFKWLKDNDIRLIIFHGERPRYLELVKREPENFHFIKDESFGLKVYEVRI